ncbi:MAG: Crp/Fnr family transcriptional regulator [Clostridia bacterium]|nr:Crp/Fnr family transcriptional regulator [Clostridia bacterium]
MKSYKEVLRRCPLFRDISDDELIPMLGCLGADVREYKRGDMIFSEGDTAKFLGIVLSGEVQIEQVDYYGNRDIVGSVGVGGIFGETFACAKVESLPVDVICVSDCEIMLVGVGRITKSCSNACAFHSMVIYNLMQMVAEKNLMLHKKIEIISRRTTREKLMAYLLYEAKRAGSDTFEIPYDRQSLADYLDVDRSGLSVEISKLRAEGIIEADKKHFTLLTGEFEMKE